MSSWKPSKPSIYNGERNTLVLQAWLSNMKDYLDLSQVPDTIKVQLAGTFLRDSASIWYLSFRQQWSEQSDSTILWETFVQHLLTTFMPPNHQQSTMDKWAKLRQVSSVDNYNKAFRSLLLQLPDNATTAYATLDKYIRGLKPKTAIEVQLRDPQTLAEAMTMADKFDTITYTARLPAGPWQKPQYVPRQATVVPMELDTIRVDQKTHLPQLQKLTQEERTSLIAKNACFRCRQPGHIARDCPSQAKGDRQ
jgi:hypothetical protein